MNLNWILNPAALYGALALALILCLTFFVDLKCEIQAVRVNARKASETASGSLIDLVKEVQGLKERTREIEAAPATLRPGETFNLTKRAQALRMHRRGEPLPTIAAALRTPENEIRLLLKIQEVLASPNQ